MTKSTHRGLIIVLSAPSGAGKTTLAHLLQKDRAGARFSISCTTRARRPGEREGRDYYFVSEKEFKALSARRGFVEWALVHGNYYGTPRALLEKTTAAGRDIILDIDVQGGLQVKKKFPEAVLIFIAAPGMKELKRRLQSRGQDDEATIRRRLANAADEMKYLPRYDYMVVNDDIARARALLSSIVAAEHARIRNSAKESAR